MTVLFVAERLPMKEAEAFVEKHLLADMKAGAHEIHIVEPDYALQAWHHLRPNLIIDMTRCTSETTHLLNCLSALRTLSRTTHYWVAYDSKAVDEELKAQDEQLNNPQKLEDYLSSLDGEDDDYEDDDDEEDEGDIVCSEQENFEEMQKALGIYFPAGGMRH